MNTDKIETWVWVLIYVGMAVLALGFWSLRGNAATGQVLIWAGALLVAAGVVLIFVRARIRTPKDAAPPLTAATHTPFDKTKP